MKTTVKKQLLAKSAIALTVALAATGAQAADVNVTTNSTTQVNATANGDDLTVTGAGNLAVTGDEAITAGTFTNVLVNVNTTGAGVSNTGDFSTIDYTNALNTVDSITVTDGLVTGAATTAGKGTIAIAGAADTYTIETKAAGSITNTGTGGDAIVISGAVGDQTATVLNAGNISTTNNAGSIAIDLTDASGGSSVAITNSAGATLNAGALGTAINIGTGGNSGTITSNAGTITGAITAAGASTLTVTSNTGTINGNITTATGALAVTNATGGDINGNISTTSGDLDYVGNGTASLDGNLVLGTNASSSVALNGTSTVTGNITVDNAGQVITFNGGNIDGGGDIIATTTGSGDIAVTANTTLGSGTKVGTSTNKIDDITVSNTVTLNLDTNDNEVNADRILLTGATGTLTLGSGILNVTDVVGATDGAGVLNINDNRTSVGNYGTGANSLLTLNIASGKTLTLGGNVDATTIAVGNGTLALSDTNRTVTGNITVGATGTLDLDDGTHTGTGTITTVSGSTIRTDLVTGSVAGNIGTGGSAATIASGTKLGLDIATGAGNKIAGGTYTLVDGTGGTGVRVLNSDIYVNGVRTTSTGVLDFASTTNGAGDADLAVTVTRHAYGTVETNSETTNNVLDAMTTIGTSGGAALDNLNTYLDAVNTREELTAAAESATAETDNAATTGVYKVASQALNVASDRLAATRGQKGVASGDAIGDKGVWIQGFGTTADQGNRNGVSGYDADTYGIAIGADKQISDRTRVGISLNYANTDVDSKAAALRNTDIDTYQVNVYGTQNYGKFYTEGLVGFAWNEYETDRAIIAPASRAKGEFDGQTYLARIGGGYTHTSGNFDLTPSASLTYAHNSISDYTETGAGILNQVVDNDSTDVLEPRVGVNAGYTFNRTNVKVRPELRASVGYDVIGDSQTTTSRFAGAATTYKTEGADVAKTSVTLGAGIDLVSRNNVTLSADYDYETRSDYDAHSGLVRLRYDF